MWARNPNHWDSERTSPEEPQSSGDRLCGHPGSYWRLYVPNDNQIPVPFAISYDLKGRCPVGRIEYRSGKRASRKVKTPRARPCPEQPARDHHHHCDRAPRPACPDQQDHQQPPAPSPSTARGERPRPGCPQQSAIKLINVKMRIYKNSSAASPSKTTKQRTRRCVQFRRPHF